LEKLNPEPVENGLKRKFRKVFYQLDFGSPAVDAFCRLSEYW